MGFSSAVDRDRFLDAICVASEGGEVSASM